MKDFFHHEGSAQRRRSAALRVGFLPLVIAFMLLRVSAVAQVTVGENLNLNLSGDIATGYNANFGDNGSTHGLGLGGNAMLHGYYYNPQFLTFDFQPFYNRSQSNSVSQSITNSSGFVGTASFFNGSHYPGSFSIGKTFDDTGQFGIPGVTGLQTTGSGQTINLTWNVLLPERPTLHASYIINGNEQSVPGISGTSHTSSRTLNLDSSYKLEGFQLRGYYAHGSGRSEFPAFLAGQETGSLENGSNQYGGTVTHAIPLRGYWTAQVTHSTFGSDFGNGGSTGTNKGSNTSFNTSVTLSPLKRLAVGVGYDYQTNAFGALQQQIIQAGGANPYRFSEDSHTSGVYGSASYAISNFIFLTGQFSHREQTFGRQNFAITQGGGGVSMNYSRRFLGSLSFSLSANDTATQDGNTGAGLFGNVNFARRIRAWEVTANFNYAQSVATLGGIYTTSQYGYGSSVSRKFGEDLHWGATFIGNHSGIQRVEGSTSHSNTISTYMSFRRYNVNALYSQSAGISILTGQGLIPIPGGTPPPLLADALLYNAKSYAGGFGVTLKRLNLSASYGKALSDLIAPKGPQNNSSTVINARLRYRVRKMYFDSGFTRFQQSIGAAGGQPVVINSYYVGISRWFNVF